MSRLRDSLRELGYQVMSRLRDSLRVLGYHAMSCLRDSPRELGYQVMSRLWDSLSELGYWFRLRDLIRKLEEWSRALDSLRESGGQIGKARKNFRRKNHDNERSDCRYAYKNP